MKKKTIGGWTLTELIIVIFIICVFALLVAQVGAIATLFYYVVEALQKYINS